MKKRVIVPVLFALLLSGCFETSFNFKTVVYQNGKIDREVQINGAGADRFLPPTGPLWEIKTAEKKPSKAILGDAQYHIHAVGHFPSPDQWTSDFRYDTQSLVAGLTEEKDKALLEELRIPEPFEKEIGTANRIQVQKKHSLFSVEYHYTEVFEIRHLISILLYDLKKDIVEDHAASIKSNLPSEESVPEEPQPADSGETASQLKTETQVQAPAELEPEKVELLALEELRGEILPKFQFHSEVTLPGKIAASNAAQTYGATAVWDFQAADFENDFSVYTLHAVSKAPNFGALTVLILAIVATVVVVTYSRQKKIRRKKPV